MILALALGGLGRDACKVAAALALLATLAAAFAVASVAGVGAVLTGEDPVWDASPADVSPAQQAAFAGTAAACGLPWQVVAAVAKVGPRGADLDATHLQSTARALCADGGARDIHRALLAVEPDARAVDEVLAVAAVYGWRDQEAAIGQDPASGGASAPGIVAVVRSQLGKPYVWGGASPQTSFDCSGLMQWAFGRLGIRLPRTAQQQYDATARVPTDALAPGDMLFFAGTDPRDPDTITHVGLYVGGGQMISAENPSNGVKLVALRGDPDEGDYWQRHLAGAGRAR